MRHHAPLLPYEEARLKIRDLDVLAWEGRGLVSRAISAVTGGSVTHVGIAAWWNDALMVIENREFRGGRAVRLREEIPPQGVLVFRAVEPLPDLAALSALSWAIGSTGSGYSYAGCARFLRRYGLPLRAPAEDRGTRGARFCSEAVSAIYRAGGIDLRPDMRDAETSPADLVATSKLQLLWRVTG